MTLKKKLLVALCAIVVLAAVVAASVMGTVAYMVSASKVSNVFTIGNVLITLNEGKVDANGKLLTGDKAERVDANSYHLMPGKSYDKDPKITVDPTTDACYLFLVTRNQITDIQDTTKQTMAQQMYANGWAIYKDTTAGSRVWIYCGSSDRINKTYGESDYSYTPVAVCGTDRAATAGEGVVVASQMIPIFQEFHLSNDIPNIQIYSGAEVTINAIGIQADSFGTIGSSESIDKAWAAVVAAFPYINDQVTAPGGQN